ncbi:MAG TPA: hypothetical protein VNQ99_10645 [Xanthobacteraceae bacterium]|nr:hypothetical protein [Xanthobacteraceae bacterium]
MNSGHKFAIGQNVIFTARPVGQMAVDRTYEVVRQLPFDGSDRQYRIKATGEPFERVARESQLALL